ncbi:MAG TPA: galactose oxidase early set domain-containing protein, partial [Polyangia bacterium]
MPSLRWRGTLSLRPSFAAGALVAATLVLTSCEHEPLSVPDAVVPQNTPTTARLFADDFSAAGAPRWEPLLGQWQLFKDPGRANHGEYVPMPRQYGLSVAGDGMWTDYRVQARVTITNDRSGPVGVAARVHGPHYYYELVLGPDPKGVRSWFIRQQRNHSWITLASGPFNYDFNITYTLRFEVTGNALSGAIAREGENFIRLGDTKALGDSGDWSLGRMGLITYGGSARFDDVVVDSLATSPVETTSRALTSQAAPWGPVVTLRDDTTTFANRPAGGWYVTPIHASLLAGSGQILLTGFGRRASADCTATNQRETGETWLLDPASLDTPPSGNNLLITPLNEQNNDPTREVLYCAGHSVLPDGRLFYSGGTRYPSILPNASPELGLAYSRIFNPATGTFTRISAPMKGGQTQTPGMKWYPTNLAMPDGKVLMFGGFHWLSGGTGSATNLSFELFDPKVWDANNNADPYTVLTQHNEGNGETPPTRGYTNLMLLPKPVAAANAGGLARSVAVSAGAGRVFLFNHEPGPSGTERLFARPSSMTPNPSGTEKGEGASGLVLPDGRLMFTNGGHDGLGAARAYFYDPYADSWSTVELGISRLYGSAIFLADGTILLINGYTSEPGNINDVVNPIGAQPPRQAQIINPYTNPPTVTTLPAWPEPTGRGYHSVALLLKDGRVLVGGGKDNNHATGCEKNELRIFQPPYISNGPRPTLQMTEGATMTVGSAPVTVAFTGTVRATRGVALVRPGALTHSFDQSQRYVPLVYTQTGPGTLSVTPPPDLNVAPPGDYVMYVISDVGTPSQGVHVRVA